MDMGWSGWLAATVAVLLTGISKSGFGGALGGLAVPVLALWMPTTDAVGVMLPILIAMDLLGLRAWRKAASWPDLYRLLPASLLGIVLGTALLHQLDVRWCQLMIGLLAIGFAVERMWKRYRVQVGAFRTEPGWLSVWCGAASGMTSALAHAGGPPVMYYLLQRNLAKNTFVATLVVLFTGINLAKLPFYLGLGLVNIQTLWMSLLLLPCVPVGVWLGMCCLQRVPEVVFFRIALLTLLGTGLQLTWQAVRALNSPVMAL